MMARFLFWLIIGFLFLIIELGHPGLFFFLSFSLGAFATSCASYWYDDTIVQALVFLGSSSVSLVVLQMLRHRLLPKRAYVQTNVSALIGRKGIVVKAAAPHTVGQVKIGGEIWSARSIAGEELTVGMQVVVQDVRGTHVLVMVVTH